MSVTTAIRMVATLKITQKPGLIATSVVSQNRGAGVARNDVISSTRASVSRRVARSADHLRDQRAVRILRVHRADVPRGDGLNRALARTRVDPCSARSAGAVRDLSRV